MGTLRIYRRYFAPRKNQVEFEIKTSNSCQSTNRLKNIIETKKYEFLEFVRCMFQAKLNSPEVSAIYNKLRDQNHNHNNDNNNNNNDDDDDDNSNNH